jgi:hypothetical protein
MPGVSAPVTNRNHCISWSDWTIVPEEEETRGIRLDTNYYYWPAPWVDDSPGLFTGSGFPMRFAQTDGTLIDVYQATTQMTDESGQSYPATAIALMDRALGPEGYFGTFVTNFHTDSVGSGAIDASVVAAAQARGVPLITSRQLLDWIDGRNASTFENLVWDDQAGTLGFEIGVGSGANGLEAMLPIEGGGGTLSGLTRNGNPVAWRTETIKGITYAIFTAASGPHVASYTGATPQVSAFQAATEEQSSNVTDESTAITAAQPSGPLSGEVIDTAAAQLASGTTNGTAIAEESDGEVILAPQLHEEFTGPAAPGWTSSALDAGGGVELLEGQAALNGAQLATDSDLLSGQSVEFVATFAEEADQHIGLGSSRDVDTESWARFSSADDGSALTATTNVDGEVSEVTIPGDFLGEPHRYRIDLFADSVAFSIDGTPVHTTQVGIPTPLQLVASDASSGGDALALDWIRVSPYRDVGAYESRVIDGGAAASWTSLDWTGVLPAGTWVEVSVRAGDTPLPDDTWSSWSAPAVSPGPVEVSGRYVQYRLMMGSSDDRVTPSVGSVTIR